MNTDNNMTTRPDSYPAHPTWPYWSAAVIVLLGFALYVSGNRDGTQLASAPAIQSDETVGMRTQIMTAAEVRSELYSSLSAVRVALQSMNNPTTVHTYLPQLQEASDRLDRVNDLVDQLSPPARRGMAASLAPTMRPLNQMIERVLAMPDTETAKPTIDTLRSKLEALSRA